MSRISLMNATSAAGQVAGNMRTVTVGGAGMLSCNVRVFGLDKLLVGVLYPRNRPNDLIAGTIVNLQKVGGRWQIQPLA